MQEMGANLLKRCELVQGNPVRSTSIFERQIRTLLTELYGMSNVDEVKKERDVLEGPLWSPSSIFGVVECQKRGALHFHSVLWNNLSPHYVSELIHIVKEHDGLAKSLGTTMRADLPERAQRISKELYGPATLDYSKMYRGGLHIIPDEKDDISGNMWPNVLLMFRSTLVTNPCVSK